MPHGYPRSPNPSTKFSDSSSVSSAASPRLLALGSRFLNGQPRTGSLYPPESSHHHSQSLSQYQCQYQQQQHQSYPYHPSPESMAGESIGGGGTRGNSLPPSDPLSSSFHNHNHSHGHGLDHGHGHANPHNHGHAHTPGPAYTSLPSLQHGPMPGLAPALQQQQQQQQHHQNLLQQHPLPQSSYTHQSPPSSQPSQHNIQKRAYRQRRKDPSCDACRERKVKCDATETTSCSECSNRQVKCQFTKETNRRMSSIKQLQDLERQLDRLKRENTTLKRVLNERGCDLQSQGQHGQQHGNQGQPLPYPARDVKMADADSSYQSVEQSSMDMEQNQHQHLQEQQYLQHLTLRPIPGIGSNPRRRRDSLITGQTAQQLPGPETPLLDFSRTRSNLRMFAKGVWDPPHHGRSSESAQPKTSLPNLPPRDAVDTLLHAYYTSIHAMLPMIHWPTFQSQVDSLYDFRKEKEADAAQPQPQPQPPASFVALFFSVLAVGGQFCTYFDSLPPPSSSSTESKPGLSAFALADTARSLLNPWSLSTCSAYSLDDVRTLLLLSIVLSESNCRSAAWTWLAIAVRAAQSINLDRDPDPGFYSHNPAEAEMRRRVWWAVYITDRSLSLELGNRPSLLSDDDCDVSLPSETDFANPNGSSAPQTQLMVAILNVVRSYSSLSSLLSAASLYRPSSSNSTSTNYYHDRPHSSSSSLTTPSPSSSFATPSQSATTLLTSSTPHTAQPVSSTSASAAPITPFGTSIPPTYLATFDRHFAACFHSFPAECSPISAHHLSANLLGPLVHLLNARLVLHRHNLSPTAHASQQQYPGYQHSFSTVQAAVTHARLTAIEQCTITALETAKIVRRVQPDDIASGKGATALLATHLTRCILFLLLGGHVEDALVLVHSLSKVSIVRREVAVPCGRWLACFISCLSFKRAEYTAYLSRATPPQTASITVPSATLVSAQVYDALRRDEELLVYVSADMQASLDSSWVWQGETETAATASPTGLATTELSNEESRMGLTAEQSRDWGGWDSLENRVRSLAVSGTSTPTHAIAANVPPPTSYSTATATTGTASPIAQQSHYTYQPYPCASSASAFGGSGRTSPAVKQEHPHYYHPSQPPPSPHPQSQSQSQSQYQPYLSPYQPPLNGHQVLAKTPSASEIAASAIAVASAATAAATTAPSAITSRPLASSSATPRVDTGPGGAAGASTKSRSEERISIANII